jgi:hypothetical protein
MTPSSPMLQVRLGLKKISLEIFQGLKSSKEDFRK